MISLWIILSAVVTWEHSLILRSCSLLSVSLAIDFPFLLPVHGFRAFTAIRYSSPIFTFDPTD
jgi:hypothetical protein